MSTNSECGIVEVRTNAWYYLLEDRHAPQNAWDWREHAQAYGPFNTADAAVEHLRRNHANPGGYWTSPLPPGKPALDLTDDAVLQRLISEANGRRRF